jgi:tRNA (guanine26-N2/guanine27-N2)-dimethyltransferase
VCQASQLAAEILRQAHPPKSEAQAIANTPQCFCRTSVQFQEGLSILEALSASGLRSIRYAKEVPGVSEIIANDISEKAVSSIRANVEHNGVEHLVTTSHEDAV